jgi:hypothetical protein
MADKSLSHEDIERWVQKQPIDTLERLPNNIESREAKRLIEVAAKLAHQALEGGERAARNAQS